MPWAFGTCAQERVHERRLLSVSNTAHRTHRRWNTAIVKPTISLNKYIKDKQSDFIIVQLN